MKIPFHRADIGEEEIAEVIDSLKSGWLTTGPKVRKFENSFAEYIGGRFAVAVNSCTAGMHLALEAIGVSRGDAVIVPTLTFAATAEVVRYLGAEPVFVDCQQSDFNLDTEALDSVLSAAQGKGLNVKAIMPVHYGGQMVDMAAVSHFATQHGLQIVEDAAHCCPAGFRESSNAEWESVGARSVVAAFSFYANKTITTGEGGMAVTDDEDLAERMRIMSLHGMSRDAWKRYSGGTAHYDIVAPGFKYNMTDLAGAIGIRQLEKADRLHAERERLAGIYRELISDVEEVTSLVDQANRIHSRHLFVVKVNPQSSSRDRDEVAAFLKNKGIGTSIHWRPLHMQTYYRERYGFQDDDFPSAARAFDEMLTLPLYPGLRDEDIALVVDTVKQAVR